MGFGLPRKVQNKRGSVKMRKHDAKHRTLKALDAPEKLLRHQVVL